MMSNFLTGLFWSISHAIIRVSYLFNNNPENPYLEPTPALQTEKIPDFPYVAN